MQGVSGAGEGCVRGHMRLHLQRRRLRRAVLPHVRWLGGLGGRQAYRHHRCDFGGLLG